MSEGDARLPLVHLKSIGCRTNQEELITLKAQLQKTGFLFTEDISRAAIVIVNTCAVTAHTESKTRRMLQTIAEQSPQAKICVTGCLAQQQPENIASLKGIYWVVGNTEKKRIPEILSEYDHGIFHACFSENAFGSGDELHDIPVLAPQGSMRTRFSIKIQEGCDYRCAYCVVPLVRGPARSFNCDDILSLCKRALGAGYRELILTGTHIGQYCDHNSGFAELLLKIVGLEGDFRVRLSSLDPRDLTAELVDLIGTHSKICDHLHVSTQHFDRNVLNTMGRGGTDPDKVMVQLKSFRHCFPNAGLGADLIVGFPGETESQFNRMLQIVEQIGLSYAHVFRYSVRPGTAAEHMPGSISDKEKSFRSEKLRAVIAESRKTFIEQCIGNPQRIIVESEEPVRGLTSNYLHVELNNSHAVYNSWLDVTITGFDNNRYLPAGPCLRGSMMQNQTKGTVNDRYHRVIEQIDHLPSLPSIVTKLIQVVNSSDTSAEDAASLIEKDPALTTKMLRLANSAFYGIPRSISSVSSAVVILGFNTIRSLVLSASVMKMFPGENKRALEKERFWKHSIVCAIAAKMIVRHFINVRMMDPESAFCAGILHDIGKLIFNEYVPEEYNEAFEHAKRAKIPLITAEKMVLGINHAEICRMLADKWTLPLDLEYALVFHHTPGVADKLTDLITTVHFADILTHELGLDLWDGEVHVREWEKTRSMLKVGDNDYKKLVEIITENVEKSIEFFNIIK